jgi:hypothetical protein
MEISQFNFNDSFKIEKFIQEQTKLALKNQSNINQQISALIAGRAGTHRCYHRNLLEFKLNKNRTNKKPSKKIPSDILKCTSFCRFRTKAKSILFALVIICLCITNFKLRKKSISNVLVFSIPSNKITNIELYNFFSEKRISEHLASKNINILVNKKFNLFDRNNHRNVRNTRYIPFYILRNNLSIKKNIHMQKVVIRNLFELVKVRNCDPLLLCFKELIFELALYKYADLSPETTFVYTQSNLRVLSPVSYVLENTFITKNIMIWYSTNSELIYKKKIKPFLIQNNYLSLDRIDCHLVWDEYAKTSMEKMTDKPIYSCGSLLFYPKPKIRIKKISPAYKILIFDITPADSSTEEDFVNPIRAVNTIRDIINVTDDLKSYSNIPIEISIKPKRKYSKSHSNMYLKHLKNLVSRKKIVLLNHSLNLYEVVSEADLVICFPWTSPALIARELGVNVIYYVSDVKKEWNLSQNRDIECIRSEQDLKVFIKKDYLS